MQDDYWEQSTQPLVCLCFVAPLLVMYEAGIVFLGPAAMRNGADLWLRDGLASLGLAQFFFLPALTCSILLGWHHVRRQAWELRGDVISGMVCECFVFGAVLILFAQLLASAMHHREALEPTAMIASHASGLPHLLSYLGAGIYEEVLFRLLLLSGFIQLGRQCGATRGSAVTWGVATTSILFAAAHYRLFFQHGLEFCWFSFSFRMLAGGFFSILFLKRGFGIAVGTHAVYDILVASAY